MYRWYVWATSCWDKARLRQVWLETKTEMCLL